MDIVSEVFTPKQAAMLCESAKSMSDRRVSKVVYTGDKLTLVYDGLSEYKTRDGKPFYAPYERLNVVYVFDEDAIGLDLTVTELGGSRVKKRHFGDTVEPLEGLKLVTEKFEVDKYSEMTLELCYENEITPFFKQSGYGNIKLKFMLSKIIYKWQ